MRHPNKTLLDILRDIRDIESLDGLFMHRSLGHLKPFLHSEMSYLRIISRLVDNEKVSLGLGEWGCVGEGACLFNIDQVCYSIKSRASGQGLDARLLKSILRKVTLSFFSRTRELLVTTQLLERVHMAFTTTHPLLKTNQRPASCTSQCGN